VEGIEQQTTRFPPPSFSTLAYALNHNLIAMAVEHRSRKARHSMVIE
jgi:hypothetical protein